MSKSRGMPPHLQRWFDKKTRRTYLFFRKRGHKRAPLPQPIGSEEFWIAYKAALKGKTEIGSDLRSKAGSVSAALAAYYTSQQWGELSKGTRDMRRPILERFRKEYGDWPLRQMTENFITAYLELLKPHAARNHLKGLRGFLRHAKHDVTRNLKPPKAKSNKHPSWSPEAIALYEVHHAIGTKPRLCFALAKCTGAGRTELTRVGPQHIGVTAIGEDQIILPARQKTGVDATIPLHPELKAIIEATPLTGFATFLVTKTGKPYSPNDLSDQFREWCDDAGVPKELSLHGLRHTLGDRLAENEATPHEIASVLAHKSIKSALHYTQGADRKRMARKGMSRIIGSTKQDHPGNAPVSNHHPVLTLGDAKPLKDQASG
jgi:integrase